MHFVIPAGPREVDKDSLAAGLAKALVGQPCLQWSLIQARPWWTTQMGSPRQMAEAHARFNSFRLHDFIEAASTSEGLGLPFSFFAGIRQMSPAEVVCCFEDPPRGLFWRADGSAVRTHLPANHFVTGTLDENKDEMLILSPEVHRHAMTIQLDPDHCPSPSRFRGPSRPRLSWQQAFITSGVRRSDGAREKLARILPEGCAPLARLDDPARHLGTIRFPSSVSEKAWIYLVNTFDHGGARAVRGASSRESDHRPRLRDGSDCDSRYAQPVDQDSVDGGNGQRVPGASSSAGSHPMAHVSACRLTRPRLWTSASRGPVWEAGGQRRASYLERIDYTNRDTGAPQEPPARQGEGGGPARRGP
jgi:hypothetical protein